MESFRDHVHFLQNTALRLRVDLLKMLHHAQSGHLGGSLSIIEMLTALYYGKLSMEPVLRFDPKKPGSLEQDYFILSKGHAAAAWYVILADCGFFPMEELTHFRQINSLLQAYPVKKIPGVVLSSGNPAYGFAASIGLAMALKIDKQPNRVVCLVGDGEMQDGQFWEAALLASHYKLDNLTLLIDWNGLQMDGAIRTVVGVEPIADKLQSFGWKTIPVIDGHDFEELLLGLEKAFEVQRRPAALIARTVKGKGVPFVENKPSYHAEVLSEGEMAEALPYLEAQLESLQSLELDQ